MTEEDRSLQRVVSDVIARAIPSCAALDPLGVIDKECLYDEVEAAIEADPILDYAVEAKAKRAYIWRLINRYFQDKKAPFVASHAEAVAILRSAEEMREYVDVPRGGKKYDRKRRMDLGDEDLDALIAYHAQHRDAHGREVLWCQAVKARRIQLGLPTTATVADVLGYAA